MSQGIPLIRASMPFFKVMNENVKKYRRTQLKKSLIIALLALATLVLSVVSVSVGASGIGFFEVIKSLFGVGENAVIVRNIRLPRTLAALIAGAGLALAGCVMQNVLKNPMASPSTLGVSNAAVFGANFAIVALGAGAFHSTHGDTVSISNPYIVTICAFVCALGSTLVILALSGKHKFSSETVVLAGVAIGSLFSAGTTILQYFALDTQVAAAVFWTFGDLGRASMRENGIMASVVLVSAAYFFLMRHDYNAIAHGEEVAQSLGVRTQSLRFFSLLFSSVICAVCVSFLGIIGFVGLVAPQLVKRLIGGDNRFLLPASAFAGCILLLLSDTFARTAFKGVSLPVGAVTSLLGAPMFLFILIGRKGDKNL